MARCRATEHDYEVIQVAEEPEDAVYLFCRACGDYTVVALRRGRVPASVRAAFSEPEPQ